MRLTVVWFGWALGLSSIGGAVWLVISYGMPAPVMAFGAGVLFVVTALNWWMGLGR